jgi:hypothetical protein
VIDAHVTRRNLYVQLATVFILALGVFAWWATWSYVRVELRRLEPWQIAAELCGDGIAAIWFVRFAAVHLIAGKPLVDEPAGPRVRATVLLFVISMIAGLLFDIGVTVYFHFDEQRRYEAGQRAVATVQAMHTRHAEKGRNYTFDCTWKHPQTGQVFETTLRIHATPDKQGGWLYPTDLDSVLRGALRRNEQPATLPIRYDPDWPGRTWIEGSPDDENGLFYVSLFVHFGQAISVLLIVLLAWSQTMRPGQRILPWWLELARVIPTAAQIIVVAFVGTLMLLIWPD